MQCHFYDLPGQFLEDQRDLLLEKEAATQLNRGNAEAHREEPCGPGLFFGCCREGASTILAFGNMEPFNLCVDVSPQADSFLLEEGVKLLAQELTKRDLKINGINAPNQICALFIASYPGRFSLHTAMDIMVVRQLLPPASQPGASRRATTEELPLLTRWGLAFCREVNPGSSEEEVRTKMEHHLAVNPVFLYEVHHTPVSLAISGRDLPHGASISWVYTPPEYRGKGYAQCNVAALCQDAFARGKECCTLFVDKKNPISNRVYEKIGFKVMENCYDYRLDQSTY